MAAWQGLAVLELRLALPSEERGSYLDATFQVP